MEKKRHRRTRGASSSQKGSSSKPSPQPGTQEIYTQNLNYQSNQFVHQIQHQGQNDYIDNGVDVDIIQQQYNWSAYHDQPQHQRQEQSLTPQGQQTIAKWNCVWYHLRFRSQVAIRADIFTAMTVHLRCRCSVMDNESIMLKLRQCSLQ